MKKLLFLNFLLLWTPFLWTKDLTAGELVQSLNQKADSDLHYFVKDSQQEQFLEACDDQTFNSDGNLVHQYCEAYINSEICQNVKPHRRFDCNEDFKKTSMIKGGLGNTFRCLQGLGLGVWDILALMGNILKAVFKFIISPIDSTKKGGEGLAQLQNYISTDYTRELQRLNKENPPPDSGQNKRKAMQAVSGIILGNLMEGVEGFLNKHDTEFSCLNTRNKWQKSCRLFTNILSMIAGGAGAGILAKRLAKGDKAKKAAGPAGAGAAAAGAALWLLPEGKEHYAITRLRKHKDDAAQFQIAKDNAADAADMLLFASKPDHLYKDYFESLKPHIQRYKETTDKSYKSMRKDLAKKIGVSEKTIDNAADMMKQAKNAELVRQGKSHEKYTPYGFRRLSYKLNIDFKEFFDKKAKREIRNAGYRAKKERVSELGKAEYGLSQSNLRVAQGEAKYWNSSLERDELALAKIISEAVLPSRTEAIKKDLNKANSKIQTNHTNVLAERETVQHYEGLPVIVAERERQKKEDEEGIGLFHLVVGYALFRGMTPGPAVGRSGRLLRGATAAAVVGTAAAAGAAEAEDKKDGSEASP